MAAPRRARRVSGELAASWQLVMGVVLDQRFRWAEVAAELGLSQAGLRALLAIDPENPRPQRELASAMNCDPSYVTAMVDDLEHAGYAVRRPDTSDRRVKTVALTPTGVAALGSARAGLMTPPHQLTRLSASEQRTLADLLRSALDDPQ